MDGLDLSCIHGLSAHSRAQQGSALVCTQRGTFRMRRFGSVHAWTTRERGARRGGEDEPARRGSARCVARRALLKRARFLTPAPVNTTSPYVEGVFTAVIPSPGSPTHRHDGNENHEAEFSRGSL